MKLKIVRDRLITWWKALPGGLDRFPWRNLEISPYRALFSEILLQRTRRDMVARIYNGFFKRFPYAGALAAATEGEIINEIKHIGLTSKAHRLHELAKITINSIPEDLKELIKLPGVGPYTAGSYLSLHRKKRAIIPDVNMTRVLGRVFGFKFGPETQNNKKFLDLCERMTPEKEFMEFNYAALDLGYYVCVSRKPRCERCPLSHLCFYHTNNHAEIKRSIDELIA
ncbi:MAG: hypothetical protein M1371_04015 [Actinobacteria bacterium]|nr:hypothetical protein [Actinomycetota bacterium]